MDNSHLHRAFDDVCSLTMDVEDERKKLDSELYRKNRMYDRANEELVKVKEKQRASESQIAQLKADLEDVKNKYENEVQAKKNVEVSLNQQLKDLEGTTVMMRRDIEEKEQFIQSLRFDFIVKESALQAALSQNVVATSCGDDRSPDFEPMKIRIKDLETALQKTTTEKEALQVQVHELLVNSDARPPSSPWVDPMSDYVTTLREENEQYALKVAEEAKKIKEIGFEIVNLKREIGRLSQENKTYQKKLSLLSSSPLVAAATASPIKTSTSSAFVDSEERFLKLVDENAKLKCLLENANCVNIKLGDGILTNVKGLGEEAKMLKASIESFKAEANKSFDVSSPGILELVRNFVEKEARKFELVRSSLKAQMEQKEKDAARTINSLKKQQQFVNNENNNNRSSNDGDEASKLRRKLEGKNTELLCLQKALGKTQHELDQLRKFTESKLKDQKFLSDLKQIFPAMQPDGDLYRKLLNENNQFRVKVEALEREKHEIVACLQKEIRQSLIGLEH